jgi:hypothetical protein
MKKILMVFACTLMLTSCLHTYVDNPGVNNDGDKKEFVVKVDSSEWMVKKVYMKGDMIYVLVPVGSTVSVREVDIINHKNGKSNTATIIVR